MMRLAGDTNDTAGSTGTGVTSLEGLGVAALSEIVSTGVDDDGSANDGVRAKEGEALVGNVDGSNTVAVSLDITEVTNVPLRVRGSTVVLAVGVEVGTGRGTAVGVVSKFVDVEASLGVGVEVLDVTRNGNGSTLLLLGEGDNTGDGGVTLEDSNSLDHFD